MEKFINEIYQQLINEKDHLSKDTEEKLDILLKSFPYVSALHNIKLWIYKKNHNFVNDELLHKALLYCPERNEIYRLLKGQRQFPFFEAYPTPFLQKEQSLALDSENRAVSTIIAEDNFVDSEKNGQELPTLDESPLPIPSETLVIFDWSEFINKHLSHLSLPTPLIDQSYFTNDQLNIEIEDSLSSSLLLDDSLEVNVDNELSLVTFEAQQDVPLESLVANFEDAAIEEIQENESLTVTKEDAESDNSSKQEIEDLLEISMSESLGYTEDEHPDSIEKKPFVHLEEPQDHLGKKNKKPKKKHKKKKKTDHQDFDEDLSNDLNEFDNHFEDEGHINTNAIESAFAENDEVIGLMTELNEDLEDETIEHEFADNTLHSEIILENLEKEEQINSIENETEKVLIEENTAEQIAVKEIEKTDQLDPDFMQMLDEIDNGVDLDKIEENFKVKIAAEVTKLRSETEEIEENQVALNPSLPEIKKVISPLPHFSDFTLWLLQKKQTKNNAEEIKSPTKTEPLSTPKKTKKKGDIQEIAKKSLDWDDEIVSETLAEILASQGFNTKAIEMYQKLILKFPEKMDIFAAKIKNLES